MKEMTDVINIEDIEGFENLTEVQKEYFRVMQNEPDFRMTGQRPGKAEIICGIIIWVLYILDAFYSNNVNVFTYLAFIYIIGFVIFAFEEWFC